MADATTARSAEESPSAKTLPGTVLKAKASTKYYAGTMQTADSSGRATNPTSLSEIVAGVVVMGVDNSAGANDAKSVELRTGPHWFAKHANAPTAADLLKPVYASDNQTISRLAADGSLAGILLAVESTKVCVWVGPPATGSAVISGITALAFTNNTGGSTADATLADGLTVTAPAALTAVNPDALTATAIAAADATDLASAQTLANELKLDYTALLADVTSIRTQLVAAIADLTAIRGKVATAVTDLTTQNDNDSKIATNFNTLRTNLTA